MNGLIYLSRGGLIYLSDIAVSRTTMDIDLLGKIDISSHNDRG